jgi:hypothetical protein
MPDEGGRAAQDRRLRAPTCHNIRMPADGLRTETGPKQLLNCLRLCRKLL